MPEPRLAVLLAALLTAVTSPVRADQSLAQLLVQQQNAAHPPLAYQEARTSAFLNVPLESRGTLQLNPDGSLIKDQTEPQARRIRIGTDRVTVTDAEGVSHIAELDQLPGARALALGLRALFKGDEASLRAQFKIHFSSSGDAWTLTLTPTDHDAARYLADLRLSGVAAAIQRIVIDEADGDSSTLSLQPVGH